jgi:ribokinase
MSKVIVAGSINMDIVANSARHPEPGETILGKELKYFPGGKGANQAVAAAQAGAQTLMCGAVGGDDFFTDELVNFLNQSDVDTTYIVEKPKTPTGTALIRLQMMAKTPLWLFLVPTAFLKEKISVESQSLKAMS